MQKARPGKPERAVGRKGIYKPGSVADNDLSRPYVAIQLKPPFGTRRAAALFQLVLLRIGFTWQCGRPHPGGLLPRLSTLTIRGWRYLSVALSLESPRPAVSRYPALWSPDFPHDAVSGIPPLSNSLSYKFYCIGKWSIRQVALCNFRFMECMLSHLFFYDNCFRLRFFRWYLPRTCTKRAFLCIYDSTAHI